MRVRVLALLGCLALGGCVKLDFFLFDGEPARLEDYDFEREDLDGVPADRITSTMVEVGQSGQAIHVVFIERDPSKLDPRIDPADGVTVVYSHGNSGNNMLYWHRATHYEDMGFNVVLYDYRGYGASEGRTTETHTYADAEAAFDWAGTRDGVGEILSVGYSMGGGPAIWLCSPEGGRDPFACFTEGAFASTEKLLYDGMYWDVPSSWMLDVEYDNETRIGTVTVPFLLMHGRLDQRVGFESGEMLWAAVGDKHPLNRFEVFDDAGHRDVHIPSYPGEELPTEYSHPDELPPDLAVEYAYYRSVIVEFVVDALAAR